MDADVIVLGGGPAGAACALFTARLGYKTAIIDQMGIGGQLINVHSIKDYPGFPQGVAGWDLAAAFGEQAQEAGVEVVYGSVQGLERAGARWQVDVDGETHKALAVVIATGCSPAPVPGETSAALTGAGVSYCATCDGEFFRGQKVAVVGGGDTAMSEASYLAEVASEVVLLFQEQAPHAAAAWRSDVEKHENIHFLPGVRMIDVAGDATVTGLLYIGIADGSEHELEVSGVFGAVGLKPNSEPFSGVVETDEQGFIRTDANLATSAPNLFAVGDVRAGSSKQVAGAVGEGVTAAVSVKRALNTG